MFSDKTKVQQQARFDVFYTLVPIGYVCKFCGLLPVKLTRNNLDHTSHGDIDFPLLVYGVALALSLIGAQCWGLYRDLHDGWQNSTKLFSRTAIAVGGSDVFFVTSVAVQAILGSSSRGRHVLQALYKIAQVDEKLDFTTARNLRWWSIILIACTVVYTMGISTLDYVSWGMIVAEKIKGKYRDKGPINYCPLYLMYGVTVALQMQYAIILMNLEERFTKLNSTIEELTKTKGLAAAQDPRREVSRTLLSPDQSRQRRSSRSSSSIEGVIYKSDVAESIDQLTIIYDLLCDSIVHLNKAFGVQLLMCTLSSLVHLVITLYFLLLQFNSTTNRWSMIIRQVGWIVFHVYRMCLFVQPPHMVASKARYTGSLVSQALASNWNPEAQKQFERFTLHLLQRPVQFSVCGLFYLDRGLMASIAGAVTTYLVILLQFQSSSNEDTSTSSLLGNASELLKGVEGS